MPRMRLGFFSVRTVRPFYGRRRVIRVLEPPPGTAARLGDLYGLLMLSGAMVMIIDFNRPRGGFIHVDSAPLEWTIQGFASGTAR